VPPATQPARPSGQANTCDPGLTAAGQSTVTTQKEKAMGATVTCQKAAAAFRSPAGIPVYVLFESTYEKNCIPHMPRWACHHIGSIEGALKRIFSYAADCEGGMLQTRRGATSPEAYIADWLRCLAAPADMPDRAVRLTAGPSYLETIRPDQVMQAAALLASYGLSEAAGSLEKGGKPELRLHRDTEAIVSLYGAGLAAPWRLIEMTPPPSGPAFGGGLGYAPKRGCRTDTPPPPLLKLDDYNFLMQAGDDTWHLAGWAYTIIGCHVRDAWEAELAAPGQYRNSVAALRRATRTAPPLPDGTQALVHGVDAMDKGTSQDWVGITQHHEATATPAGWTLAATPALVGSLVHSLGRKHLSWLVPSLDAPPQACLPLEGRPPGTAAPA